jgi:AcrR family transcriptional regulator
MSPVETQASQAWQALSPEDRAALEGRIADPSTPRRHALRARIVLHAARGATNREIAEHTGVSIPTVMLWRKRYATDGLEGLNDLPRSGRPRSIGGSPTAPRPVAASTALAEGGTALPDDGLEPLLEAAARTIARRGFAATRMADIAHEAGVSPATVHYHFKVKEEILVRALLWAHERLINELERAIATTDDPVARLAMLIERTVPYAGVQRDEYLLEIDLWSQVRLHPQLLPAWESYDERWMAHVTAMIEAGISSGDFTSNAAAHEVAERLVAMTDGLAAQTAIGSARMPPERVRDLVLRFTAEQLGVDVERLEAAAHLHGLATLSRRGYELEPG